MHRLHPGDALPELSGETVDHGPLSLPADIPPDRWAMVLVYRAHW